jgi:hypothetical protein
MHARFLDIQTCNDLNCVIFKSARGVNSMLLQAAVCRILTPSTKEVVIGNGRLAIVGAELRKILDKNLKEIAGSPLTPSHSHTFWSNLFDRPAGCNNSNRMLANCSI